jgi:hypothetical protein
MSLNYVESDRKTDEMDALTWPSLRAEKESAWHGHVSFAHWLTQKVRPKLIVELGSHNGVSYSAFCNAVVKSGLQTRCYAVDTWQGDAHAGYYSDNVYLDLLDFNKRNFSSFSVLLRSYFDDALKSFADGSIDILHIDGLHTYEAVKHDFLSWRPKLSDEAIVLFHDTEVRQADFGVWTLWSELIQTYRGFNFLHSAGLGVLAVGKIPSALISMFDGPGEHADAIRNRFVEASAAAYRNGLSLTAETATAVATGNEPGHRNIALNRHAMQSSVFQNGEPTPQGAVNGVKNGGYGFHTELEMNPWWMIDLERSQTIQEIVIFNRIDAECGARSRNISVLISQDAEVWDELYFHTGVPFGGVDGFPLRIACNDAKARFVRIRLNDFQYLHLDEVEIYN